MYSMSVVKPHERIWYDPIEYAYMRSKKRLLVSLIQHIEHETELVMKELRTVMATVSVSMLFIEQKG